MRYLLALFDPLLGCFPLTIESHYPRLGRLRFMTSKGLCLVQIPSGLKIGGCAAPAANICHGGKFARSYMTLDHFTIVVDFVTARALGRAEAVVRIPGAEMTTRERRELAGANLGTPSFQYDDWPTRRLGSQVRTVGGYAELNLLRRRLVAGVGFEPTTSGL